MTQFEKMQTGEIDDSEIISAKKYLTNALNSMNDSLRGMEDYYLSQAIMGTAQSIDDVIACINKVEKNQISDVMKKVEFDTVYFLKFSSVKLNKSNLCIGKVPSALLNITEDNT